MWQEPDLSNQPIGMAPTPAEQLRPLADIEAPVRKRVFAALLRAINAGQGQ